MCRVLSAAAASSPFNAGLASSRNQSHTSFHANSYSACDTRSKRYAANCWRTSAVVAIRRARIQRSASVRGSGRAPVSTRKSPTFISAKRTAFHSLLQKFL